MVFLRFNGYGIKHPEVFVCCGLIAVAGLGWGLLMGLGQVARVLVTTFLLVLLVDVQTEWLTTVGLRLLLNVALLGAATWFLRRHLAKIVMVVFGAMAPA